MCLSALLTWRLPALLMIAGVVAAAPVLAGETASLHVKRDAARLELELRAPLGALAADGGVDARKALEEVAEVLLDVSAMFRPTLNANCRLLEIRVGGGPLEAAGLAGRHAPDEARSEQLRAHGTPLADAAAEGYGDTEPPETAQPADADEEQSAPDDGDVRAHYEFECARPAVLRDLMVPAFASFPELRSLQVTLEDERAVRESELSASNPMLLLR